MKKLLSMLLCMVLCFSFLPTSVQAEGGIAEEPAVELTLQEPAEEVQTALPETQSETEPETEELLPEEPGLTETAEEEPAAETENAELTEPTDQAPVEETADPKPENQEPVTAEPAEETAAAEETLPAEIEPATDENELTEDPAAPEEEKKEAVLQSAEDEEEASLMGSAESIGTLTWELNDNGVLTILGTGDLAPSSPSSLPWYSSRSSITTVVIGAGVTSIGNSIFSGYSKLKNVTIIGPSKLTSIGHSAFMDCSELTQIEIPEKVTSISNSLFYGCKKLEKVVLPEGITSIGTYAFYNCNNLREITIPSKVTSIGNNAFSGCWAITTVKIPSGVTRIQPHTFSACSALQSVEIPSGVYEVGNYAFSASALPAISLPASIRTIGDYAFSSCGQLKEVTFVGGPPSIQDNSFQLVRANVHYPDDGSWSASKRQNYGGTLTWIAEKAAFTFTDVQDRGAYFYNPVYWAVDKGITSGKTATTFAPYDPCTRAQVMSFLYKAMESPAVSGSNPFTDVKEGDYFYKPVLWAVSQGITSGTSETTFSPYNTCTRAQVMTFLYKAMN